MTEAYQQIWIDRSKESTDFELQFFVTLLDGKTITIHAGQNDTVDSLKSIIEDRYGLPAVDQRLLIAGSHLENGWLVNQVSENSTVQLVSSLRGGKSMIEPSLMILAQKYNCDKLICRKCYARLHPKATNCRKRKCGHSPFLRKKKILKE